MDKRYKYFSFSITNGIATLVYSDFISKIQKLDKGNIIMIPEIRSVNEILHPSGTFMKHIADRLVVTILEYYNKDIRYHNDELDSLLKYDNSYEMQKILIDEIIPNSQRVITEVIRRKFFPDDNNKSNFYENRDSQVFDTGITYDMVAYVIRASYLQLLRYTTVETLFHEAIPELDKVISGNIAEDYLHIVIRNPQEIAPVIFDKEIIKNKDAYKILSYVTNTAFIVTDKGIKFTSNANNTVKYF